MKILRTLMLFLIPKNFEKIKSVLERKGKFLQGGEKKMTFRIEGVKVELYFTTRESWGAILLAFSLEKGSAIGLRVAARKKGFCLNQYGLFKNGKYVAGKTEKEIYEKLNRPYKEPWER